MSGKKLPTAQSTKSAARCGFDELADQINEAHRLAQEHAESAIDYAFRVGDLLLQAKSEVKHGKWLPWLRDNVQFSERTAQTYMRLYDKRKTIERAVADEEEGISVRKAIGYVSRPLRMEGQDGSIDPSSRPDDDEVWAAERELIESSFDGDIMAYAEFSLERPFCAYDICGSDWTSTFTSKLLRHLEVPPVAAMMLSTLEEYEPIPMLRLVCADDLCEAIELIGPVVEGKTVLPVEARNEKEAARILAAIRGWSHYMCYAILAELEHREGIDFDAYSLEFEETRQQFVATAEARLGALISVAEKNRGGGYKSFDEFAAASQAAVATKLNFAEGQEANA